MKLAAYYSHLNGLEYLLVHKPTLWDEIKSVIAGLDAESHRTKVSKEKRIFGKLLYAPTTMNAAMAKSFKELAWESRTVSYFVTDDERLIRKTMQLSYDDQKAAIKAAGKIPFPSYNQTDFVKERCMVEVQFGKYSFIAHDLFVKHMAFYTTDHMDVGVEILPMKALQAQMSSGVPYYEGALYDLIREGRGVPHVPLVLVGVEPDAPVDKADLEEEAAEEEVAIERGQGLDEDR
jgi:hypothetical protein